METPDTSPRSISLLSLLCFVFAVLKTLGIIDWSWWWVMSPIWIYAILAILLILVLTVIALVSTLVSKMKSSRSLWQGASPDGNSLPDAKRKKFLRRKMLAALDECRWQIAPLSPMKMELRFAAIARFLAMREELRCALASQPFQVGLAKLSEVCPVIQELVEMRFELGPWLSQSEREAWIRGVFPLMPGSKTDVAQTIARGQRCLVVATTELAAIAMDSLDVMAEVAEFLRTPSVLTSTLLWFSGSGESTAVFHALSRLEMSGRAAASDAGKLAGITLLNAMAAATKDSGMFRCTTIDDAVSIATHAGLSALAASFALEGKSGFKPPKSAGGEVIERIRLRGAWFLIDDLIDELLSDSVKRKTYDEIVKADAAKPKPVSVPTPGRPPAPCSPPMRTAGSSSARPSPPPKLQRYWAWAASVLAGFWLLSLTLLILWLSPSNVRQAKPAPVPVPPAVPAPTFENSLGMKFISVPVTGGPTSGQKVQFCIHETRIKDYAAYAQGNRNANESWKTEMDRDADDHPVVFVTWTEARSFCAWLTEVERANGRIGPQDSYRLPTNHEWSCAVGIGEREDASASPQSKNGKLPNDFPWGGSYPPGQMDGNYRIDSKYDATVPVMRFKANTLGIYDLGGNVWEWCEDGYAGAIDYRYVLRGGCYNNFSRDNLLSSFRYYYSPGTRSKQIGFRIVLVGVGSPLHPPDAIR